MSRRLACVEVGGSGTQTVLFDGDDPVDIVDGATCPPGWSLAIACPGVFVDGRVDATNLGWAAADPAQELGFAVRPVLLLNDAAAAALGEAALVGGSDDLLYIGLGTGIGGARVLDGRVIADNLLGHQTGFGDRACRCGSIGCLETVGGGWSLPDALDDARLRAVAHAVAHAVRREPAADAPVVVVAGGILDRHPRLVELLGAALPGREVRPSARPAPAKSAAPWGLRAGVPA